MDSRSETHPIIADAQASNGSTKRQDIIAGATDVFLRLGYGAASMEGIAQAAGVSKQTIYAHFDGKDALFEAIIHEKCDELRIPAVPSGDTDESLETVLFRIAQAFLKSVLSRKNVRLFRIIVSECGRFPELADAFYRSGPRSAVAQLARYLETARDAGEIAIGDPVQAAELFFAMLRGDIYMRRLMGIDTDMDEAEAANYARFVVDSYMRAVAGATLAV